VSADAVCGKQLPGSSDTAASFEFTDEDHTLGNALRYIIMKKCVPPAHFSAIFPLSFFLSRPSLPRYLLRLWERARLTIHSPNVEFCGYSIPHPSEPKMNIRIQTYEGTAFEALAKGFDDLADLCDVVLEKFSEEREAYGQH